ncbi:MAG: CHASE domain-containing protein [Candidatus Saccharimonadales bacterium]
MKKPFVELVRERSRLVKIPVITGSLIIAAGVLATYAFANYLAQRADDEFQTQTNDSAHIFAETISSRITNLEQTLFTLGAYTKTQTSITADQWSSFIQQSKLVEEQPYLLGIGYVDVFKRDQLAAYIQSQQAEKPGFAIQPSGDREVYSAIRYLEPRVEANQKVIGYDMYSEKTRQSAMSKARDQDEVALTTPVTLIQDQGKKEAYGVLAYYPVYQGTTRPTDIAARRSQLVGYTFIAFRPHDFITELDRDNQAQLASTSYAITDSSTGISMTNKVFDESRNETKYNASAQVDVIDRQWMVAMTAYQPAFQRLTAPGITFLLGIATSIALGVLVTYLMTRRLIRLDIMHQDELQRTKDELLALTSHQLRTPASGVKQYVGMLLQGFVGELTPQQESIAKKAFAANERQLETINQLLHVAKADADQLVLQKDVIDLVDLTRQVIDSMAGTIDDHESEVIIKAPKQRLIYVFADERYLRMVVENLISNALKYSEAGKPVRITITARNDNAIVSVRDYGVGIEESDIKLLFKKFARIPNPLSKTVGGSGLGLFLSEQIMLAHNGDIEIDSKIGKGSIFTITVPLHEEHQIKEKEI